MTHIHIFCEKTLSPPLVYKQSRNSTAEIMLIDTISFQHLSRQGSHES